MSKDPGYLLVPMRVEALVIEGAVGKDDVLEKVRGRKDASTGGDLKWSPLTANYANTATRLVSPGPEPFFGAKSKEAGKVHDEVKIFSPLIFEQPEALPRRQDRGVYLRWILPPTYRCSRTVNALDFPPLPDQWVILRLARRTNSGASDADPFVKAWVLDSGTSANATSTSASLLFAVPPSSAGNAKSSFKALRVGNSVALEDYQTSTTADAQRIDLTALGNETTGSVSFSASTAENRNVLSWHDDLQDLRVDDKVPEDLALTYLVAGWHREEGKDPLRAIAGNKSDVDTFAQDLAAKLQWQVAAADMNRCQGLPSVCLLHGTVTHVNFWNSKEYRGPLLGYPGAPQAHGIESGGHALTVAVGTSVREALTGLFVRHGEQKEADHEDGAALWRAVEAAVYRQLGILDRGWEDALREPAVHRDGFVPHDGGIVWSIVPRKETGARIPTAISDAQIPVAHLTKLVELNQLQSRVDALRREIESLREEIYAWWWQICRANLTEQGWASFAPLRQGFTERHDALRIELMDLAGPQGGKVQNRIRALHQTLADSPWLLQSDPAPRFWSPADPVIVARNAGDGESYSFPSPLQCRTNKDTIASAAVSMAGSVSQHHLPDLPASPAPLSGVLDLVEQKLQAQFPALSALLGEAWIVERAVSDLIGRQAHDGSRAWGDWKKRIADALNRDASEEAGRIRFHTRAEDPVALDSPFFTLWLEQPWSPLFIDWSIRFHPAVWGETGDRVENNDFRFTGEDYHPTGRKLSSTEKKSREGYSVTGRSLLAPISGRVLTDPLLELRERMKWGDAILSSRTKIPDGDEESPEDRVAKKISRYESVWSGVLNDMGNSPLLGQALSGLHQSFLHRSVTRPRVMPNPAQPWLRRPKKHDIEDANIFPFFMDDTADGGSTPFSPRLGPPVDQPSVVSADRSSPLPFLPIRAGWMVIEQLWIVDAFGQWTDLLSGSSAGGAFTIERGERLKWPAMDTATAGGAQCIAMPPRIVQPARLAFEFTSSPKAGHSVDNPICGWLYHHFMDEALAICDQNGKLLGELASDGGVQVQWQSLIDGQARLAGDIENSTLREFVTSFCDDKKGGGERLRCLLGVIERHETERGSLGRLPADEWPLGRPLALVDASLEIEVYGAPLSDPAAFSGEDVGKQTLSALELPVLIGSRFDKDNSLIGYFKRSDQRDGSDFYRFIARARHRAIASADSYGGLVGDALRDASSVRIGSRTRVTLLCDSHGTIEAGIGLLPAEKVRLAQRHVDAGLKNLEASIKIGPVLRGADSNFLPVPGNTRFHGYFLPAEDAQPEALGPFDLRAQLDDRPRMAVDGRLILRRSPMKETL